jgi:methylated-DNA-protein-cysteine methyltransferase related protein
MYEEIYQVVKKIPRGAVSSYGKIAQTAGYPRGARLVGWALRALPPDTTLPWWRVISRQRLLTIINPKLGASEQAERLTAEGRALSWDGRLFWVLGADWWPAGSEAASESAPAHQGPR